MKYLNIFKVVFLFLNLNLLAQNQETFKANDSIFISFNPELISNKVLINKRNYFGDTLPQSYTMHNTMFLFTTDKFRLKQNIQNKYRDSLIAIKRPLGMHKTPYGIELVNYNIDFETAKKNFEFYNSGVNMLSIEMADSLALEKMNMYKRILKNDFRLPLSTFSADKDFFKKYRTFSYSGSDEDYSLLEKIINLDVKLFIILPAHKEFFGYEFRVLEVKQLIRPPRL